MQKYMRAFGVWPHLGTVTLFFLVGKDVGRCCKWFPVGGLSVKLDSKLSLEGRRVTGCRISGLVGEWEMSMVRTGTCDT